MDREATYQIEVSGMDAEVVIATAGASMDITVYIGGKQLTESNLGPAEVEALRRFFIE